MPEVTDPNLLAKLNGGAAPRGAPQPVLTVPDYNKQADNARADQKAAEDSDKAQRDAEKAERERIEWEAKFFPDGTPRPQPSAATEAQQKSSLFYGRMLAAERDYNRVPAGSRDARTVPGQWFADTFPRLDASLNSSDRVSADNAARNFIAASLRLESGAAISEAEYENQYKIFFPMPGDGPEQIAEKAKLRQQVMQGFRITSGPLAGLVEQEFQTLYGDAPPTANQGQITPKAAAILERGGEIGRTEDGQQVIFAPAEGSGGSGQGGARAVYDLNGNLLYIEEEVVGSLDRVDGNDSFFRMPKDANEFWQGIKAGTGDIVQGAGDTLGIVGNPLNATVNAITGLNLSTDLGKALVDITGLPTSKGAVNTINRAATSGLMFGGGAATLGARALPGVARNALLQVGANPVGDAIVGGAAAGSGEAVKAAGGGEAAQAGAMLVGGLAGAGAVSRLGRNAPAIVRGGPGGGGGMPRAVQPTTEGGEVIAAADRLNTRLGTNIEPMPADVGGPFIRRATGGGAQFPLAASPIISQAKTVSAETQAARDAIARIAGNAVDPENAGEAALSGATKYMQKSKTKVDALYAKARRMGGDELVDLPKARTVLDRNIAELAQTPGGATGLARMKSLRAELDQPYPVEGIKRMRTSLRDEFISDGLRGSDVERRMKQVIDAADDDIAEGLAAAGKADAAGAYREAAKEHRERVETIDEVLAPFIGRNGDRSGEQVFQAIANSTAKNNKGLAAFMKAIPAEDAATVRASIIGSLGKSSAGRQDAEGMGFSAGEFLTHWNKLSPGAKSTLFGGELRAALDDLAKVAGGSKEAQKYANFSNTGSVLGITATGGSGAAAYADPVTGGALLALQYVTGKMLASPKIARLIAKMPKDPRKARAHIQGLRKIAGAERAIAPQVNYLFDQIANDLMVTGGPARLAAEPDGARGPERSAKPTTMPVPK